MKYLKKIEDSVYHKWYNEDTLIDEKDGVNEAWYIKDLKEKIDNLTSVIESGKPVCPYCKSELELLSEERSYLEGGGKEAVWKCWCTE
jgi:transposase-like protein